MDCIHDLAECPECGGLKVTTYTNIGTVTSIELGDGHTLGGGGTVYIAPLDEPCPNPPSEDG